MEKPIFNYSGVMKKGISPLIATVMLVAFTLAAAAIISGWLTSTLKTSTEAVGGGIGTQMECSKASLDIADAICSDNGNVTIAVTNVGPIAIFLPSFYMRATDGSTCVNDSVSGTGYLQGGSSAVYKTQCLGWETKILDFVRVASNCQNKTAIYGEKSNIADNCTAS
jgi:flagellin-like protein